MHTTITRGALAACLLILALTLACQPPVPTRQIYLPADCPLPDARGLAQPDAEPTHAPPTPQPPAISSAPIPTPKETTPQPPPEPQLIDLNTATDAQLQTLPGIGPAMAKRILARRAQRPFRRVRDLRRVRGVGPATYKRLKDRVSVSQDSGANAAGTKK